MSELEVRSDKSASLLCAARSSSAASGSGSGLREVELVGSRAKDDELLCLLSFDAASGQFTLERVSSTVHHLKPSTGEPSRKRKMDTPAAVPERATRPRAQPAASASQPTSPPPAPVPAASSAAAATPAASPSALRHAEFAADDGVDIENIPPADAARSSANALPPSLLSVARPVASPTAAAATIDFDFSFPTAASLRSSAESQPPSAAPPVAAAVAPALELPSFPTEQHSCSLCHQAVLVPPDLADDQSESGEARRDFLHCDSCFDFMHKECASKQTGGSVQRAPDGMWTCASCRAAEAAAQ